MSSQQYNSSSYYHHPHYAQQQQQQQHLYTNHAAHPTNSFYPQLPPRTTGSMSNHLSPSGRSDYATSSSSGASPADSQRSSTHAGTMSTAASSTHSDTEADSPAAAPATQPSHNGSSSKKAPPKPVTCQWDDCSVQYDDPEELYRHLCDDHVGRKSTNNLCLTCKWQGCDVTCAKRDHITSHLRVHTPLKPHSCDTCGKTFKRPQDLKKHERIHTEAHQLAQQARAKGLPLHGAFVGVGGQDAAAAAAAYNAYRMAGQPPAFGGYPAMPVGASRFAQQTTVPIYPSLPGQTAGAAAYPQLYPQQHRELTPQSWGVESNASVSPLSSHLGTPGPSGSASYGANPYVSQFTPLNAAAQSGVDMKPGSYIHYALGERPKPTDDTSSYLGLARGNVHASAGQKRSWDESVEVTRGFVQDVANKHVRPTYDQGMAQRLEHTFAGGLDEASLSALLASIDSSSMQHHAQQQHAAQQQHDASTLSALLAGANNSYAAGAAQQPKRTDLAELNAFLLQLGAHAAKDLLANANSANAMSNMHSSGSLSAGATPSSTLSYSSSDMSTNPFDVGSLSAYGLADIPGFDESLFNFEPPTPTGASSQTPWAINGSSASSTSNTTTQARPTAALPARATYGADYRHSHGHALVPQLAANDVASANYRRVEALTRAAPVEVTSNLRASPVADTKEDRMDVDEEETTRCASPMSSNGASEAAASPAPASRAAVRGLYPRLSPVEGARSPTGSPTTRRVAPYDVSARHHHAHSGARGASSSSSSDDTPSPPPTAADEGRRSMPFDAPRRSNTVDGIADDVAALNGLGVTANAAAPEQLTMEMRASHVRLIRDLLLAINYPGRRLSNSPPAKLAPLRLPHPNAEQSVDEEQDELAPASAAAVEARETTPTRTSVRQAQEDRKLPAIAELLRSIPSSAAANPPVGPGGRRLMDIDV